MLSSTYLEGIPIAEVVNVYEGRKKREARCPQCGRCWSCLDWGTQSEDWDPGKREKQGGRVQKLHAAGEGKGKYPSGCYVSFFTPGSMPLICPSALFTISLIHQDKVNAFWEITKKELEDKKAELRNKDREIEEMEERQQVEIKVISCARNIRLSSHFVFVD